MMQMCCAMSIGCFTMMLSVMYQPERQCLNALLRIIQLWKPLFKRSFGETRHLIRFTVEFQYNLHNNTHVKTITQPFHAMLSRRSWPAESDKQTATQHQRHRHRSFWQHRKDLVNSIRSAVLKFWQFCASFFIIYLSFPFLLHRNWLSNMRYVVVIISSLF